jgi:hypothetical protein
MVASIGFFGGVAVNTIILLTAHSVMSITPSEKIGVKKKENQTAWHN